MFYFFSQSITPKLYVTLSNSIFLSLDIILNITWGKKRKQTLISTDCCETESRESKIRPRVFKVQLWRKWGRKEKCGRMSNKTGEVYGNSWIFSGAFSTPQRNMLVNFLNLQDNYTKSFFFCPIVPSMGFTYMPTFFARISVHHLS